MCSPPGTYALWWPRSPLDIVGDGTSFGFGEGVFDGDGELGHSGDIVAD